MMISERAGALLRSIWRRITQRLVNKLILLFTSVIILVVGSLTIISYQMIEKESVNHSIASTTNNLLLVNQNLEDYLEGMQQLALPQLRYNDIMNAVANENRDYALRMVIENYLRSMFYSRNDLEAIYLYVADRHQYYVVTRETYNVTVRKGINTDIPKLPWYQEAMKSTTNESFQSFVGARTDMGYVAPQASFMAYHRVLRSIASRHPQVDYNTILKSKIASGSTPDVFQTTAGGDIDTYADYSADLTNEPLAAAMTDAVRANMSSSDGKVLGLPVKGNLFALIYNKDLLAKAGITSPPKTIAEMQDAVTKLEAKGITPFANAYKEWWVWKHIFQHYVDAAAQDGGVEPKQLVSDFIAGKAKIKDYPVLYNNFFSFVDLTVKHGTDKPLERDSNAEVSDFASGKAAFMTGKGAWDEEAIKKINPDLKIGIMGYPVSDKAEQSVIITGADQALRINKDSEVAKETIEFFNWLYTSEYGKNWFSQVAKVIPPIKDAPLPDLEMPKEMESILKTSKSGDLSVNYSLDTFHQKFGELMQAYISGNMNKDQAVAEIEKAWVQLGSAQ